MQRIPKRLLAFALATTGAFATQTGAQSSGGAYRIDPIVVAGGGGTVGGGAYELRHTFGQHVTSTLTGADFRLNGGFWGPVSSTVLPTDLFADGFEN